MKSGISVLVYGRNDSHGYNLHKRAALSLNCIAHVLSEADEILFCDCNTPDDLPTFPEAIADTLTERARALLRVVRVRPAAYRRLAPRSKLPVCEPFCRNVVLRRSNPANHWILSTNTDMLFRPLLADSLGEVVADLPDRLHIAPRLELPELCWESLDRMDPATAISQTARWGSTLRLNHLIRCKPPVLFDGPGDFQLLPRAMAFELDGFDESIVDGWHVDGNLCARAALHRGRNEPLHEKLYGYHCDHNRIATHTHTSTASTGDLHGLIHEVTEPTLPRQRTTWGAAAEALEIITLTDSIRSWRTVEVGVGDKDMPATAEHFGGETHNQGIRQELSLVLPHLISHLVTRPRQLRIGYLGLNVELLAALNSWAERAERRLEFFLAPELAAFQSGKAAPDSLWDAFSTLDVVIVDADPGPGAAQLGVGENPKRRTDRAGDIARACLDTLEQLANLSLRLGERGPRILALNAQNSWVESALSRHFALTLAPYASRVRPVSVLIKRNRFATIFRTKQR